MNREPANLSSYQGIKPGAQTGFERFAVPKRVQWIDRAARLFISSFSILVILAVALILVFVCKEAAPLFYPPTAKEKPTFKLPTFGEDASMLSWSVDEFHTYSYGLADDGYLYFISNKEGSLQHRLKVNDLAENRPVKAWVSPAGDQFIAVTDHGRLKFFTLRFKTDYAPDGSQILTPTIKESPLMEVFPAGRPHRVAPTPKESPLMERVPTSPTAAKSAIERVTGAFNPVNEVLVFSVLFQDGMVATGSYNPTTQNIDRKDLKVGIEGRATGMVIDMDARFLVISTEANRLYRWDLQGSDQPIQVVHPSSRNSHVTSLELLLGSFTYILGFADGSVEAWFGVRQNTMDTELKLQKIRDFERHSAAVRGIIPSAVQRGFWTYDDRGQLKMHFNPSGRKLYTFESGGPVMAMRANSHLDGITVLTAKKEIRQWRLNDPHPDITLSSLFSKVWYEGYEQLRHIWQSSSGSDNFEAKFGLVPLLFGTIKGAFYGLIFAIPLAVLAALYTSQLMQPRIRSFVKPTIEIMAALPSVVIGFLAGLWIAPFLEKNLVAALMFLPISVGFVLGGAWLYFRIPLKQRGRIPQEVELVILAGIVVLALIASHFLSHPVEKLCFNGNIQQWIYDSLGQKVEQRNSLVIGLAIGFAVIPIIFTISEDAMSNVPRHYVSGSLALGASQWQSALRVVVPTASPGIFSAIMLGFGRAVGETMIVLMATGNTPIMSLSPFNGMRTLSANIAVEIPEAPLDGSLYRVLFLGAALLFVFTFVINTVSEVIRLRLREKYRAL